MGVKRPADALDTVACRFDFHIAGDLFKIIMKPEVDIRVFMHPP